MTQSAELQVSPTLALPISAITETFAILAKRGAGKTNAAVAMAEEMFAQGLPFVALDPVGSWWGIRAAGDGGPGLPVLVLGGAHGDLPLQVGSGRMVADLVVDQNLSCVLDLSLMDDEEELPEFATAFLRQLFVRNQDPRHVYFEEADVILPQTATRVTMPMLRAGSKLIKLGRGRGLGCTLITQRAASLNKNALTQTETLIAMRTSWPQDQDAILRWVKSHSASLDVIDALPGLADGEAFVFSPSWLEGLVRIRFRRRKTYDSGATPTVGQGVRPPTDLASIDLGALREAMAVAIKQAEADDPEILRVRVVDLERQLAETHTMVVEPVVERVEVPAMAPETVEQVRALIDQLEEIATGFRRGLEVLVNLGGTPVRTIGGQSVEVSREAVEGPSGRNLVSEIQEGHRKSMLAVTSGRSAASPAGEDPPDGQVKLGRTERRILAVLVQHGPRTHRQLALQTGYSAKASTIGVALSKLRKLGYVEPGQPITATDEGRLALGDLEPLPTGGALLDYWRGQLGKTEVAVLNALLSAYPAEVRQSKLAVLTGYSPTASTIGVALSKLRRLELVDGWKLSDDFARSIR